MKLAAVPRIVLLALAGATVVWGGYAVWRYGWRDLYADQWRLYRQFLTLPFPDNVLFLENGHRPVVPNLLRVAEIAWFHGNQTLQWAVGLLFALLTVVVGWSIVLRDRAIGGAAAAASALALALAIFWLANSRMLMHPNESVHTYLITLLVAIVASVGATLVASDRPAGGRMIACAACGLVATFSFGPGLALFVALAIALAIAGAPWRRIAFVLFAMAVTLAIYFALPGGQGVSGVLKLQPVANARVAAQWLASPIMYLFLPFLDGNLVHALPGALLRELGRWTSGAYTAQWGDVWQGVWPQAVVGSAGIGVLVLQSLACWRQRPVGRTQFAGLVFAWFGLGVAGVVAISRLGYFEVHPAQIYANRYLPWPCLFWAGLALITLGGRRRTAPAAAGFPRPVVVGSVILFGVAALASNPSWMGWARLTQSLVRHHACAVLADAYSATLFQGETVPAEVAQGSPAVRTARVAMFAHAAAGRLGTRLADAPADLFARDVVATGRMFVTDDGGRALEIDAAVPPGYPSADADYWLVTDDAGVVVGYAHFDPLDSKDRISGFVRGDPAELALRAYPWLRGEGPGRGIRLTLIARAAP